MAKKNPIQHVEWRSNDAARLQKFYGAVFSWKFKSSGMPGYTMVDFGNKDAGGGIMQITKEMPMPQGVCNYATVEDLAKHEEAIRANGGQVLMSNQEIPGVGWFSVAKDCDGNEFAIWKQLDKKQAKKAAKKVKKAAKKEKKAAKQAAKAAKAQQKAAKSPKK
jgi:predicted enzyme related to lactoylglutathione lyase